MTDTLNPVVCTINSSRPLDPASRHVIARCSRARCYPRCWGGIVSSDPGASQKVMFASSGGPELHTGGQRDDVRGEHLAAPTHPVSKAHSPVTLPYTCLPPSPTKVRPLLRKKGDTPWLLRERDWESAHKRPLSPTSVRQRQNTCTLCKHHLWCLEPSRGDGRGAGTCVTTGV
ncbi:hypothetical protein Bbelb_183000 [Branchiostoma belcheri]|nr:hypothetical protein Bbelb_183000 [Branchiostoma belcheri]